MITIAYWFVLKIPNIYPLDVWAVFLSSVLLDNKIFQVFFVLFERKIDLSNRLASFVVIKPQRKICLYISK